MSVGKEVTAGLMGAFLMEGVEIQKIDFDNNILYIMLSRYKGKSISYCDIATKKDGLQVYRYGSSLIGIGSEEH